MQCDCTRGGGVTEFLRVAAYAEMHGIMAVPHHDPQIHGHLVLAAPNGFGLETFPNKARDPLWDELYTRRPEIRDGLVPFTDAPGFGFEPHRSEEHTSELQSPMRTSYAVFCLQ